MVAISQDTVDGSHVLKSAQSNLVKFASLSVPTMGTAFDRMIRPCATFGSPQGPTILKSGSCNSGGDFQ